jgi:aryl-alcohol dehydrogenase-like predicted oxidoreductase
VEPGQSVYTADEVRAALQLPGVSRLQVPGNVFDRRAWTARGNAPVALDVRSVFLQGVLLDEPAVAEERVEGGGALAQRVRNAASVVGEPVLELLVAAAVRLGLPGDRVVIGVDSPDQLVALVRASRSPVPAVQQFCERVFHEAGAVLTERLLDPRLW